MIPEDADTMSASFKSKTPLSATGWPSHKGRFGIRRFRRIFGDFFVRSKSHRGSELRAEPPEPWAKKTINNIFHPKISLLYISAQKLIQKTILKISSNNRFFPKEKYVNIVLKHP
jgi:hypothetical protein